MLTGGALASVSVILVLATISEILAYECNVDQTDDDANCYRVSTILVPPYVMLANDSVSSTPTYFPLNATNKTDPGLPDEPRYEGFLIDFLKELARLADFRYHLRLVKDGNYGRQNVNQISILAKPTWNGLVGEIINNETDIALAPLTVTPEREQVIDFTTPFEHFQAYVVFWKKPSTGDSEDPPITSVNDLANGTGYRYGVKRDGPIQQYLRQFTDDPIRSKLSAYLDNNPQLPISNEAGLARVQQDLAYAFIVEQSAVRAALLRLPCLLQFIPTNFYRRSYALAVRKCSSLRERLNAATLQMIDSGHFDSLVLKWWGRNECSSGQSLYTHPVFKSILILTILASSSSSSSLLRCSSYLLG